MPGQAADGGNPIILPSETRSLAEMTRAVALATPDDARLGVLRDGLMRIGDGSRLGQHQRQCRRHAGARRSLETPSGADSGDAHARRGGANAWRSAAIAPVARNTGTDPAQVRIDNGGAAPIIALVDTRYQPAEPGSSAAAVARRLRGDASILSRAGLAARRSERLAPGADGALHLTSRRRRRGDGGTRQPRGSHPCGDLAAARGRP